MRKTGTGTPEPLGTRDPRGCSPHLALLEEAVDDVDGARLVIAAQHDHIVRVEKLRIRKIHRFRDRKVAHLVGEQQRGALDAVRAAVDVVAEEDEAGIKSQLHEQIKV